MNVEFDFEPRVDSEPSQSVSFRVCRFTVPRPARHRHPRLFPGSAAPRARARRGPGSPGVRRSRVPAFPALPGLTSNTSTEYRAPLPAGALGRFRMPTGASVHRLR